MSDSLMPFHPEIDEPSNILPPSKKSSSTTLAGIETCCSFPLVSVNRRSTQRTSFLLIKSSVRSDMSFSFSNHFPSTHWAVKIRKCVGTG